MTKDKRSATIKPVAYCALIQKLKMSRKSEKAILYISKHFRKKIILEEIAKISGISTFHFHRIFIEENNCTPHAYLETIRMQHASHMIALHPHWSLTEVALDSGYSSLGIFSRAFKKYYNVTPSKFEINADMLLEKAKLEKDNPIKIVYLSKRLISVIKVPLLEKDLDIAYQKLITTSTSNDTIYGFFLDAPFHVPPEQCRYYIGVESIDTDKELSILTIEPGYYTSINIEGGFDDIEEKMVSWNNQIQNRGFIIDSIVAHEKVKISNITSPFRYMKARKELYIKIKKNSKIC